MKFRVTSPVSAGERISVNLSKQVAGGGKRFSEFRTASGKRTSLSFGRSETINTFRSSDQANLRTYGVYAGDLNQDGWHDLTVVNEDISDVRVFMGDKQGSFVKTPSPIVPIKNPFITGTGFTAGPTPSFVKGADLNLDGKMDLVTAQIRGSAVTVMLGDGAGALTNDGTYLVDATNRTGLGTRGLCLLDLDGNNYYDFLAANRVGNNVSILLNKADGSGKFNAPNSAEAGVNAETACASGDFNGDGWEDVAIGGYGAGADGKVSIMLSNGDGTLRVSESSKQAAMTPWMVTTGDFDNDGCLDVAAALQQPRQFGWFKGDCKGGLAAGKTFSVGRNSGGSLGPLAITVADLDGNGLLDVLTSNYGSADWTIYSNQGNGSFGTPMHLTTTTAGSDAVIHDRNHDGILDITGVDEEANLIQVFTGTGGVGIRRPWIVPIAIAGGFRFDPAGRSHSGPELPSGVLFDRAGSDQGSIPGRSVWLK